MDAAADAAQKLKEDELHSLLLTKNLLRIVIFNISYIRGLFPEKYFNDKDVPALAEMKIKKLMLMDAESRRLIDWMEKGVYDALQKKYLKTLMFCVCETANGSMIEEYAFAFSYSNSDSKEVSMNFNRIGSKKQGEFKFSTTKITIAQMKSSACKMVHTLIQQMRTLDKMPEERTILMKLHYYDDVTPADYEPPFFRGCTEDETVNMWTKNPLKMEVGNVNSNHIVLALKVKSVLNPCEDDNVSLGGDSMQLDGDSESFSEASISDDEYIVAARDDTQDPAEDEQQLNCVRDWIKSYNLDDVDVADALSAFPDISMALIEEIMDKLVNEGLLLKAGNNSFNIKRARDEYDGSCAPAKRSLLTTGLMYMKALYHALPMEYMTISKLQSKFGGDANQKNVCKLKDKMTKEGYIEASNNRTLGKRVVQSDLTKKKLAEVPKVLDRDAMEDANETLNKPNVLENQTGPNRHETSTFGAVHSIGSDLIHTKDKSDLQQNVSNSSDLILSKLREKRHKTPTSNNQPIASIESYAAGDEKGKKGVNQDDKMDDVVCSGQSSLSKRSRKASMVKDPILQYKHETPESQ